VVNSCCCRFVEVLFVLNVCLFFFLYFDILLLFFTFEYVVNFSAAFNVVIAFCCCSVSCNYDSEIKQKISFEYFVLVFVFFDSSVRKDFVAN